MNESPLLPERAGCPQCGSTRGKRWRSYSGIELCTDCDWDFLSELNGRKLLDARAALPPLRVPRSSPPTLLSQWRQREQRFDRRERESDMRRGSVASAKWKKQLEEIVAPQYNSVCALWQKRKLTHRRLRRYAPARGSSY